MAIVINSVTVFPSYPLTQGTTTVTVTSVPAGAVVAALGTCGNNMNTPTSTNLTFQRRVGNVDDNATIWTAIAGSSLSNEDITITTVGSTNWPALTIVVLTGANTTSFTNILSDTAQTTAVWSCALTGTAVGSYILSADFGSNGTGGATSTPGLNTTEMSDQNNGGAGESNSTNRNTDPSVGGTVTLTATWATGATPQIHALLEILAAGTISMPCVRV